MDTGKAKANAASTKQPTIDFTEAAAKAHMKKFFSSGPFTSPESFVVPSNHAADDLLKRAMSQR
jgi:hypothetical protein